MSSGDLDRSRLVCTRRFAHSEHDQGCERDRLGCARNAESCASPGTTTLKAISELITGTTAAFKNEAIVNAIT